MKADWSALREALNAVPGPPAAFWLRDDDAIKDTPQLRRLARWAEHQSTELLLAVVPGLVEQSLSAALRELPSLRPCVHGWAHKNHAPPGEKKQELGLHGGLERLRAELSRGLAKVADVSGGNDLKVLVPPWNRIDANVVAALPDLGFAGLSVFLDRYTAEAPEGLSVGNTHLDVIDWRGTRGCRPHGDMVAELAGLVEQRSAKGQPIGILTHHLDHDDAVWIFLDELGALVSAHPNATWIGPAEVFSV